VPEDLSREELIALVKAMAATNTSPRSAPTPPPPARTTSTSTRPSYNSPTADPGYPNPPDQSPVNHPVPAPHVRPQVLHVGLTHQRTRLIPARWSGKLNRPTGGDLHGELVQCPSVHSHTQWAHRACQHPLHLMGRPPGVGAGQRAQHRAGVAATLRLDLRGGSAPRCTSALHSGPAHDRHQVPHLLEHLSCISA